ncbi:MAG: hypothetical protein FWD86_00620 [Firmicutes bacterium]|nr:hypothetical protein [Bacillota bacterium]
MRPFFWHCVSISKLDNYIQTANYVSHGICYNEIRAVKKKLRELPNGMRSLIQIYYERALDFSKKLENSEANEEAIEYGKHICCNLWELVGSVYLDNDDNDIEVMFVKSFELQATIGKNSSGYLAKLFFDYFTTILLKIREIVKKKKENTTAAIQIKFWDAYHESGVRDEESIERLIKIGAIKVKQ